MLIFKRADLLSKKAKSIFIPVIEGQISAPTIGTIEKLFQLDLNDELAFFTAIDKPIKAGETFEVPVSAPGYACERLVFLSFGKCTNSEICLAGAAIGRKLRGKDDLAFLNFKFKAAQNKALLISANLGNFQWNLKSSPTPSKPISAKIEISNCDDETIKSAQIVSDAVNRARTLIHTLVSYTHLRAHET